MGDIDSGTVTPAPMPLRNWRFVGELRRSQQVVLDAVYPVSGDPLQPSTPSGDPLHIVAPPGSGKTLLGLEIARRRGHRALVLAPTTTIRAQWGRSARSLASASWGELAPVAPPGAVSEDPNSLGDFTALTYQMLSVLETTNPFETLAENVWKRELVEAGRTPESAGEWIAELSESNRAAYRSGLQRRARRLRKEIVRSDASALEEALHPNARALIQRIADHGVKTIVLDECHHLLDHWAIVVHCLVARIRAKGEEPQLIGLTATLPSLEDREEYENYTGLLGEVDYELPTPAVVKEGNLAPYRDFVWFVTPTDEELAFLRTHEAELEQLIMRTLRGGDGEGFLEGVLFGVPPIDASTSRAELERRLAESFKRDYLIAEAALRMLIELVPGHTVAALTPPSARTPATTEQRIRTLARFALERLLPDPESAELWARTRTVLADFGYHLTDRGIRRGRDPVDQVLATSVSKDHAVAEILRHELAGDCGNQVRAVVILDFAQHGHGKGTRETRAGALRCFETVVAAHELREMYPVLVTAKHLRIAARDRERIVPRLAEMLGVMPTEQSSSDGESTGATIELEVAGRGPAAIVAAVSHLVTDGTVRLIVGTRGLLGEGWDCPAVNTLIDLSMVATSSSTQQLRGRTLRIDEAWPEKVAHNWTVTSVIEARINIDGDSDVKRLDRKHGRVWGIAIDGPPAVVRGLEHTLTLDQSFKLTQLLAKKKGAAQPGALNALTLQSMPPRASTRARWGIGEPYVGAISPVTLIEQPPRSRSFLSSLTLDFLLLMLVTFLANVAGVALTAVLQDARLRQQSLLVTLVFVVIALIIVLVPLRGDIRELIRAFRRRALPASDYQGVAFSIARVLHTQGLVPEFGRANISVTTHAGYIAPRQKVNAFHEVRINAGTSIEQGEILYALEEMFGPVQSPRFLLEIKPPTPGRGWLLTWVASYLARLFGHKPRMLAVPRSIGRRREYAEEFAREWSRNVGPCTLHEIDAPEKLALLTKARLRSAAPDTPSRRFDVWA